MNELAALLRKTELFRDFPAEVIRRDLLPRGWIQEFAKGQFLIEPQQQVNKCKVIITGKVNILHLFPDGKDSLMTSLAPGDILGLDLICTRSQISPYHAVAVVPTKVISFPAELLLTPGALPEEHRLAALGNLLTMISHHNMKKEYRLAILSRKGLRERIITYLTMQSAKRHAATFRIPFTRDELASFLCVNRSALSHELSLMEQEGLISFHKNQFTLLAWTPEETIVE
ncbi:MAG: Crp/Fnr family transcriptional regulator [Oscillospiraceae bacterium]|nr:Crp/Fnr family transcriptional regulator [Oscillospiraceae bacterium]